MIKGSVLGFAGGFLTALACFLIFLPGGSFPDIRVPIRLSAAAAALFSGCGLICAESSAKTLVFKILGYLFGAAFLFGLYL
ncbi:MAG: hypothetical protein IJC39_01600 [Firmicutes bacterium]|nr:hypothetical protein [Bacillota bacterium]